MGDQIDDSTNGSFMGLGYSYSGNDNAVYPQDSTTGTSTRSSAPSSDGMMQQYVKQRCNVNVTVYEQQREDPAKNNREDPSFVAAHDPDSYYEAPPLSFSPPFQEF
jgi:hypothetical protein